MADDDQDDHQNGLKQQAPAGPEAVIGRIYENIHGRGRMVAVQNGFGYKNRWLLRYLFSPLHTVANGSNPMMMQNAG